MFNKPHILFAAFFSLKDVLDLLASFNPKVCVSGYFIKSGSTWDTGSQGDIQSTYTITLIPEATRNDRLTYARYVFSFSSDDTDDRIVRNVEFYGNEELITNNPAFERFEGFIDNVQIKEPSC